MKKCDLKVDALKYLTAAQNNALIPTDPKK